MAYNANLPAGNYHARALQADTYPTKNGEGLMLGVEWLIDQGEQEGSQITSRTCLIDGSGNLTKNYESTREWAKTWDGINLEYFRGHFSEWEVIIVVERKVITVKDENGVDVQKEVPEVKWINDPNGSHGATITAGDHKAMGLKFGAKLKAAAGAYNKAHPGTVAPTSKPATGAKKQTAAKPTATAADIEAKKREVWTAWCSANPDMGEEERKQAFFDFVAEVTPETDYSKIGADTWQEVLAKIQNDMPF